MFRTFKTLQDALVELHPDRGRFQSDPDVGKAATELYNTIIRSVEDMVVALSMMEKSRCKCPLLGICKLEYRPEGATYTHAHISI